MSYSFIYNPYNLLGLPIDSSQGDVRKRVGFMEKMLAIDEPVEFDSDVIIGSANRTPDIVRECASRLGDPSNRIADAFFWFSDNPEVLGAARRTDRQFFNSMFREACGATAQKNYIALKDAAVGMSLIFEKTQSKDDFESALKKWAGFINHDSFWNYWIQFYRSVDYLDTSEQVIRDFKEGVTALIVDMFFEISQLDDLIDAQIVGKYFAISSDAAEKAAEQQLTRIKELRIEAERLLSDIDSLLDHRHAPSQTGESKVSELASRSASLHVELTKNGQTGSSAIVREFDGLWNDIMSITVAMHNQSSQHDAITVSDLEFQKRILMRLNGMSSDSLLRDRIKKNLSAIDDEMAQIREMEAIGTELSKLTKLLQSMANLPSSNTAEIESKLKEFESLYRSIQSSGKLKYDSLANAVSAMAGTFNMIAVSIANDAQESVNQALRRMEANQLAHRRVIGQAVQEMQQGGSRSPNPETILAAMTAERQSKDDLKQHLETLSSHIAQAHKDVELAGRILTKLKALQIDRDLKSTIGTNLNAIEGTLDSLEELDYDVRTTKVKLNEAQNNTSSSSGGGGCYIATAVYGSYDCPEVWTLRRFRDFELAKSVPGRLFISVYYATSPTLVKLFGDSRLFKRFARKPLDGLVRKCRSNGYAQTPYVDRDWK